MVSNRFAYSALPAETVTVNEPDDWPTGWDFPGPPWPPDYPPPETATYTVALTADASTIGIYDTGDSPTMKATITTSDPEYWYQAQDIIFSAAFTSDSSIVPIRLVGDSSYENTRTVEITADGFLGYSGDFEFDDSGYEGVPFIVTAQVQVASLAGLVSASIYMAAERYFVLTPSTTSVTRGSAFTMAVQSILGGEQDTDYEPSAVIPVTFTLSDELDAGTPATIATTGWTDGEKTGISFDIDGGAGEDTATVSITDSATGRVGDVQLAIAQSPSGSKDAYTGNYTIDNYYHGMFPGLTNAEDNPALPVWDGIFRYYQVDEWNDDGTVANRTYRYLDDMTLHVAKLEFFASTGWYVRIYQATVGSPTNVWRIGYRKLWGDSGEGTYIQYYKDNDVSAVFAPEAITISKSS